MLAAATACSAGVVQEHRRTWAEEQHALAGSLDRLEERLLAGQAEVFLWEELRERHEDVSAIACENLAGHAREMETLAEEQRSKRLVISRKNRVAAQFVPSAEPRR